MKDTIAEALEYQERLLHTMIAQARTQQTYTTYFSDSLQDIQTELRKRRMSFLGSSLSLASLICKDGEIDEEAETALVVYLTERTLASWDKPFIEGGAFCRLFYSLGIRAVTNPGLSNECLDDLIRLATLLTHEPKEVYLAVMKDLLPEDWHGMLVHFADSFDNEAIRPLNASFEDAVLGAVAVFLGVLEDPNADWEGEVLCG